MKYIKQALVKNQKIRFTVVGGINTFIDFVIFFILNSLGLNVIIANFVSTSAALSFSFVANSKFTFKSKVEKNYRHFTSFLLITCFGLWILQPMVIISVKSLGEYSVLDPSSSLYLLFAKMIATIFSLTWNYILYKRFVFNT